GGLDAFGKHPQAERVPERNDRLRDRRVAPTDRRLDDERPVDLQAVDRKSREVAQARVAGAEIVDRDLYPEALEALQYRNRFLPILDEHALGQLELERAGLDSGGLQRLRDRLGKALAAELARRNVYRHAQLAARALPRRELSAGDRERPSPHRFDEPGLFGNRHEQRGREIALLVEPPAHQGFDAYDAAGVDLHLRLVMELEPLLPDRHPQRRFQFDALG